MGFKLGDVYRLSRDEHRRRLCGEKEEPGASIPQLFVVLKILEPSEMRYTTDGLASDC